MRSLLAPAPDTRYHPSHTRPQPSRTTLVASHAPSYSWPVGKVIYGGKGTDTPARTDRALYGNTKEMTTLADKILNIYITHLVHLTKNSPKAGHQGIALLGEQRVAGLCALEPKLGVRQRHARREDGLACSGHLAFRGWVGSKSITKEPPSGDKH